MKKKKLQLLFSVLVLAVCVGGYLGIRAYNDYTAKQKDAAAEAAKIRVSSLGQITKLSFTNSNGTFSFYQDSGIWYYEPDTEFPLSQTKIETLASSVESLTAVRSFAPSDSLSSYGLEKPAYTVTATDSDGNTMALLLGGSAGDNCYAMKQDGTEIYTVASTLASGLDCTLNDLVEVETFPAVGKDTIRSVTIASPTKSLTFEKESAETNGDAENGSDAAATSAAPDVWYVSQNGSRKAVDSFTPPSGAKATDLMDQLLDTVSFLSFSSCADYKADRASLSAYGLDTPALTVTVSYTDAADGSDASFTFSVGSMNADSSAYYAVKDGSSAVNLMDAETVSMLSDTFSAFNS